MDNDSGRTERMGVVPLRNNLAWREINVEAVVDGPFMLEGAAPAVVGPPLPLLCIWGGSRIEENLVGPPDKLAKEAIPPIGRLLCNPRARAPLVRFPGGGGGGAAVKNCGMES